MSYKATTTIIGMGLLQYVPFRSKYLYHTDSVGFALAIHDFNLKAHQPHAPGFPLYIMVLRLLSCIGLSDNTAIIALNIAATIGAALLFYYFSVSYLGKRKSLVATVLLLTNPIVWFNAEVALSYSTGLLGATAIVLAISRSKLRLAVIIWSMLAGFRLDAALIMAPLLIYAHWRCSRRAQMENAGLAGLLVISWALPLVWVAGGPIEYLKILQAKSKDATPFDINVVTTLIVFLLIATLGVFPSLCLASVKEYNSRAGDGPHFGRQPSPAHFLSKESGEPKYIHKMPLPIWLWIAPGILLHICTTIGHPGYTLPYIPAFVLMSAIVLSARAVAAGVLVQVAFFLFMPAIHARHPIINTACNALTAATRAKMARVDSVIENLVTQTRMSFPADRTILITPVGNELPQDGRIQSLFKQAQYYLPEWEQRILYVSPQSPFGENVVVTLDHGLFRDLTTETVSIPRGHALVWFCDKETGPYSFDGWEQKDELITSTAPHSNWGPFRFEINGKAGLLRN